MKRVGSVLKLKPECMESYKAYHAEVWPEVLAMIRECNIRNYSIFLKDNYLFAYFEYHGTDQKARQLRP
jgi:L-rhamnose mutarotase